MILQSKNVWIKEELVAAQLEINNGKIIKIHAYGEKTVDEDYGEQWIIPGLMDIHCHGFNGMDLNYATQEGIEHWCKSLPSEGVTSFMATTSTAPETNLLASYGLIANNIEHQPEGATILGIHVEGPQISFEFKGAHNPYLIQKPNVEQFIRYQEAARGYIKMICVATEMDEEHALTRYCVEQGVKVVIGHSGAKYDECLLAAKDGATSFTHTFNGMLGVHHREPGTAGAAMAMDNMYAELICDGVHVHFAVAQTLARAKGKDKLILITDSVQIKGLKPGIYDMPGRWVEVKEDGCGRLKDGRLAGSSNKMINMVKNCYLELHAPLATAINAATINPAKFIGCDHKGLIEENYDADITVITPNFEVIQTYVAGNKKI